MRRGDTIAPHELHTALIAEFREGCQKESEIKKGAYKFGGGEVAWRWYSRCLKIKAASKRIGRKEFGKRSQRI